MLQCTPGVDPWSEFPVAMAEGVREELQIVPKIWGAGAHAVAILQISGVLPLCSWWLLKEGIDMEISQPLPSPLFL